jgi:hypothetical protein
VPEKANEAYIVPPSGVAVGPPEFRQLYQGVLEVCEPPPVK